MASRIRRGHCYHDRAHEQITVMASRISAGTVVMITQAERRAFLWRKNCKLMDGGEGERPQLGCNVLERGREPASRLEWREM